MAVIAIPTTGHVLVPGLSPLATSCKVTGAEPVLVLWTTSNGVVGPTTGPAGALLPAGGSCNIPGGATATATSASGVASQVTTSPV